MPTPPPSPSLEVGCSKYGTQKNLKECSNFGISEGTYSMHLELAVSGRN